MKRYLYLFFGFMLGSFSLLMGFSGRELQEDSLTSLVAKHVEIGDDRLEFEKLVTRSRHSHSKSSDSFILFQADLTRCAIGLNDRILLADGGADFVTSFGGNDFRCKVLKGGGIEISPANGHSFTKSIPPVPELGPVPGGLFDHVKFLAYSLFEDLPTGKHQQLCSTWVGSGEQLNVKNNPFGSFAPHPNSDPRLACFGFVSLNPHFLTTFDWICTNDVIYALVERLPGGEEFFGDYAAFTYMIPVAHRNTKHKNPLKDVHTFQTCFDSNGTTVTWILDGQPVFRVTQIGHRLNENNAFIFSKGKAKPLHDPARFQTAEHGGLDQTVVLDGIQTGLSFFTLLDFFPPATKLNVTREKRLNSGFYEGLVRLESSFFRPATGAPYYNNPLTGQPAVFFQNGTPDLTGQFFLPSIPSIYRIFGQGAKLRLFQYTLSIEG